MVQMPQCYFQHIASIAKKFIIVDQTQCTCRQCMSTQQQPSILLFNLEDLVVKQDLGECQNYVAD